ncbi:neuronal cell adhesion molecule-like [Hyalella azteca]|uniref:Neuronal cell adhesion molecule-like n=1 Tax=Hyalella azteca TaxID=294128 RepID=A0A979FY80_HYAAZ|nr:neuronal cell adhesion molecule-like [Hyalella azteca]
MEGVPSAPSSVKAVSAGASSVLVAWRAPEQPRGRVISYTVYWRPTSNASEVLLTKSTAVEGQKNFLKLENLSGVPLHSA